MFRVVIKSRLSGRIRARFDAPTLERASEEYSRLRDASGEGGSTWPLGYVYPATGSDVDVPLAYISYNGKVWSDDPASWDWRNPPALLFNPFAVA